MWFELKELMCVLTREIQNVNVIQSLSVILFALYIPSVPVVWCLPSRLTFCLCFLLCLPNSILAQSLTLCYLPRIRYDDCLWFSERWTVHTLISECLHCVHIYCVIIRILKLNSSPFVGIVATCLLSKYLVQSYF